MKTKQQKVRLTFEVSQSSTTVLVMDNGIEVSIKAENLCMDTYIKSFTAKMSKKGKEVETKVIHLN